MCFIKYYIIMNKFVRIVGLLVFWCGYSVASLTSHMSEYMSHSDQKLFWNKKMSIIEPLSITRYKTSAKFNVDAYLRRDEAAKMLVKFSSVVNPNMGVYEMGDCNFIDLENAHEDLYEEIITSCEKNIFKWYRWSFMPNKYLTHGEFFTALVRILEGKLLDVSKLEKLRLYNGNDDNHRAIVYWILVSHNELLKNTVFAFNFTESIDQPIYRGDVAIILANYIEKFASDKCKDVICDKNNFYGPFSYVNYDALVAKEEAEKVSREYINQSEWFSFMYPAIWSIIEEWVWNNNNYQRIQNFIVYGDSPYVLKPREFYIEIMRTDLLQAEQNQQNCLAQFSQVESKEIIDWITIYKWLWIEWWDSWWIRYGMCFEKNNNQYYIQYTENWSIYKDLLFNSLKIE